MPADRRYSHPNYQMRCPHCDGGMKVRSSKEQTRLVRHLYLRCDEIECGFTALASLELVGTLSPSGKPHPKVILPFRGTSLPPKVAPLPANDVDEAVLAEA